MIQYYKMPIIFPVAQHISGNISMIYIIGDILYIYDFEKQTHYKCSRTIVSRCETIDAIKITESTGYGTTTTVHKYIEEYNSEEEYLQEIEKYVMIKELVS